MKRHCVFAVRLLIVLFVLTLSNFQYLKAQQVNWRGEKRDGHFHESGLLKLWPENGPEIFLKVEGLGIGHSSAIVVHNTIYVTGKTDTLDYLSAIDFKGKIRWKVPYGRSWHGAHPETYSTPTIDGNSVYVCSGSGELVCLNANSGEINWSVNVEKDFKSTRRHYGKAESPLIVDDNVICCPGGNITTVVAFNKKSGELVWKSKSMKTDPTWTSPVLYEYNEFKFILATTGEHVLALNPTTGDIIWIYQYLKPEWIERLDPNNVFKKWNNRGEIKLILTNTPIFKNDEIFICKGYNYPAVMLKLDPSGRSVTKKWVNHTLDTHHGGYVLVDGKIYGSTWINNANGNWACIDWETGEDNYDVKWQNKGSIIYADGMIYCYEEKRGYLALVKPNPEKFEVISSFKTEGSGMHWAHPSIFNGKLFVRHKDVLMVYNISENI
ncbi:MAG: PQQ-like beta-propeller repeat protein [Bacteroidetes bacterium]|nr:PQQ-like beta-propeller repeat protein [Bacteroidota bacterium]